MPTVKIRQLASHADFQACERIQKSVWGALGVGAEVLSVTAKHGGAVLGAFVSRRLAGFLYAFLARRDRELIHWSHMMAVGPRFRDLGLGFRMKLAHRRLALGEGIRSICWTYDPLQSRNAYLNITRLGAVVENYEPDCYGRFPSAIEKGLPSDRFVVRWPIASKKVEHLLRRRGGRPADLALPVANPTRRNAHGLLENRAVTLGLRAPRLLVEIPPDTDRMRALALPLARRWRFETRKVFLAYFSRGYRVETFHAPSRAPGGRCFYLLQKR